MTGMSWFPTLPESIGGCLLLLKQGSRDSKNYCNIFIVDYVETINNDDDDCLRAFA